MTLTELKYIVAVARQKHFGHAAEACFVAQPTLSVAIKKENNPIAYSLLGCIHYEQHKRPFTREPNDLKEAIECFNNAAKFGLKHALYNIGIVSGVEKDYEKYIPFKFYSVN